MACLVIPLSTFRHVVRIKEIESAIKYLESEKIDIETNANEATSWLGRFLKYKEINELSHEAVATLIDMDTLEIQRKIPLILIRKLLRL